MGGRQRLAEHDGWLRGQSETSVWQRVYQAVGHESVQGAGALDVVGPDGVQAGLRHGLTGVPEDRQEAATALPVCPLVGLAYGADLGSTELLNLSTANQQSCIAAGTPQLHRALIDSIKWQSAS